jgi:hypothetical protein
MEKALAESGWLILGVMITLVGAWTLLIYGVLKSMLTKSGKDIDDKVERAFAEMTEQGKKTQAIEKQILELKADLPLNYVRKEDFIRHEVVINTKLDRLRDLIEGMKEDWRNKYGRTPKRSDD